MRRLLKDALAWFIASALLLGSPLAWAQYDGGPDMRPHAPQAFASRATLLATRVVGSAENSVPIAVPAPQNYAGLVITFFGGTASASTTTSDGLALRFNGDATAAHYKWVVGGDYPNTGQTSGSNSDTSVVVGVLTSMGVAGQQAGYTLVHIFNGYQSPPPQGGLANAWTNVWSDSDEYQGNVGIVWWNGSGVWVPGAATPVLTITVLEYQGNNFQPGSVIQVWGCRPVAC